MLEALFHAALRDLLEEDALDLGVLVGLRRDLHQVIRDGLALAIGVGGEQDLVGLLGSGADRFDDLRLALLFQQLVGFLEAIVDVDPAALREVFDVPLGRKDLVAGADVLLDRLRLCRGLHDEEGLGHRILSSKASRRLGNFGIGPPASPRSSPERAAGE